VIFEAQNPSIKLAIDFKKTERNARQPFITLSSFSLRDRARNLLSHRSGDFGLTGQASLALLALFRLAPSKPYKD